MYDPFEQLYTGTWGTRVLNIVSGGALLCAATWFSYNLFSAKDAEVPPRIVNTITVEPTILLAGKPFSVRINVTLNKLCPYEVRWSLVRTADNVEVVRIIEPIKQPPANLGTQDLPTVARFVPSSVEPGVYKYVAEVADICSQGHTTLSIRKNADVIIR